MLNTNFNVQLNLLNTFRKESVFFDQCNIIIDTGTTIEGESVGVTIYTLSFYHFTPERWIE